MANKCCCWLLLRLNLAICSLLNQRKQVYLFQLCQQLRSVSAITRLNFCDTWVVIFWQSPRWVAYQKQKTIEYIKFVTWNVVAVA